MIGKKTNSFQENERMMKEDYGDIAVLSWLE